MSIPLMHGTARYRWPMVLSASLAVHALVLGIPLAQPITGDAASTDTPLLVTLAAPRDNVAPPVKSAARVDSHRRAAPLSKAAPAQQSVAADPVKPETPLIPRAQDEEITTTESATAADSLTSVSPATTDIAMAANAQTARPNTTIVLARIRDTIARERYPELARRRGWEGEVQLGFRVEGSGAIDNIRVTHSSGNRVLDESAMRALQRIGYIPAELWLDGYSAELQLPVIYRLSES